MKLAAILVGIVLAASVLWLAGEEHRKSCQSAGRTGCSVLPWDAGEQRAVRPEDMTRIACIRYNASLSRAGVPEARRLDCSLLPAQ